MRIISLVCLLLICVLMVPQVALADNYKYFSFSYNGNTYTDRYSVDGGHFERVNAPAESFVGGSMEYTTEYGGYLDAELAAQNSFLRQYNRGDLGDKSAPTWVIGIGAVALVGLALFANQKRNRYNRG